MSLIKVRHCPKANASISLNYETFGNPKNTPLFLVSGLNCNMQYWPRAFCQRLASDDNPYKFFVVRFDNRDVGKSSRLDHLGEEGLFSLLCCPNCCTSQKYSLEDMALDVLALAEQILIPEKIVEAQGEEHREVPPIAKDYKKKVIDFSILGASMGGMCTMHAAALAKDYFENSELRQQSLLKENSSSTTKDFENYKLNLKSVGLLFTSPGDPSLSISPSLEILRALSKLPADESKKSFVDNMINMSKIVFVPEDEWNKAENSDEYFDEKENKLKRRNLTESFESVFEEVFDHVPLADRISSRHRSAVVRQVPRTDICKKFLGGIGSNTAIDTEKNGQLTSPSKIPTLIIHGAKDVLIPVEHGRLLKKLIPAAEYLELPDMGHSILPKYVQVICEALAVNAGTMNATSKSSVNDMNNGSARSGDVNEPFLTK